MHRYFKNKFSRQVNLLKKIIRIDAKNAELIRIHPKIMQKRYIDEIVK